MTSDDALRDTISKIPALQEDGHFSLEKYQRVLRAQGMSEPQFEAKFRQDLLVRQLIGPVSDTAGVSQVQAEAMLSKALQLNPGLAMARRGLVHNKSAQALDAFVQRQTGVSALRCVQAASR